MKVQVTEYCMPFPPVLIVPGREWHASLGNLVQEVVGQGREALLGPFPDHNYLYWSYRLACFLDWDLWSVKEDMQVGR